MFSDLDEDMKIITYEGAMWKNKPYIGDVDTDYNSVLLGNTLKININLDIHKVFKNVQFSVVGYKKDTMTVMVRFSDFIIYHFILKV